MTLDRTIIASYLQKQKNKVVEEFDLDKNSVKYADKIQGAKIKDLSGDEEVVRAYLITKLVNELGYEPESITLEKEYDIGRPKTNKPRIDVIVRDSDDNPFLFIELKSSSEFDKDPDETIEKQLYNLASQEIGLGKSVDYLVLFSAETVGDGIKEKCLVIDYKNFNSFDKWKDVRNSTDTLPARYGKAEKEPYRKDGKKDLDHDFTEEQLSALQKRLHNVLWGGGGTDDNEIFSSLVNLILAKIQDEGEKSSGEIYDFQVLMSEGNKDKFETNEQLFEKINILYRRALKNKMNLGEEKNLSQANVIDINKFSLEKLRYAVSALESYSLTNGKNRFNGKDILGDFFEGIVSMGFKQSKGQFFTHQNIVNFMLWGLQLDKLTIECINKNQLPYVIDPSSGSGTFLIQSMKFITDTVKRQRKDETGYSQDIKNSMANWSPEDHRENNWARDYIYGSEINFNLGTATKVNMILHGDGSSNIFIKDGLLPFDEYAKPNNREANALNSVSTKHDIYDKAINEMFDVIITNPPFSIELDASTKKKIENNFVFGKKKNSENLFIERWYQLLKEGGRLAAVLPDSVLDTKSNKYIRLFLFKYFHIKAIVSLPRLTFEPHTPTKTSILFAQKKTSDEVLKWDNAWEASSKKWSTLKTRGRNLIDVFMRFKDKNSLPSIKNLTEEQELNIVLNLLRGTILEEDKNLPLGDIIKKYEEDLLDVCKPDLSSTFGFINTEWIFRETVEKFNYPIFMANVESVGYKRGKRGEKKTVNELYREKENRTLVDDGKNLSVLDRMRKIKWQ